MNSVSSIDFQAIKALVALTNKQLGQTVWHFLRDNGVDVQLVTTPEEAVQRMLSIRV